MNVKNYSSHTWFAYRIPFDMSSSMAASKMRCPLKYSPPYKSNIFSIKIAHYQWNITAPSLIGFLNRHNVVSDSTDCIVSVAGERCTVTVPYLHSVPVVKIYKNNNTMRKKKLNGKIERGSRKMKYRDFHSACYWGFLQKEFHVQSIWRSRGDCTCGHCSLQRHCTNRPPSCIKFQNTLLTFTHLDKGSKSSPFAQTQIRWLLTRYWFSEAIYNLEWMVWISGSASNSPFVSVQLRGARAL